MAFFTSQPSPPRAPPRKNKFNSHNDIDEFLSSDLELSFASTMSLNSPPSQAPSPMAMDISPVIPMAEKSGHLAPPAPRLFGRDLVNNENSFGSTRSSDTKSKKQARQRSALPSQWMSTTKSSPKEDSIEGISHVPITLTAPSSDAMDVDVPMEASSSPQSAPVVNPMFPSSPSPVPVVTNSNYGNLFFDASSPAPQAHKKRRSTSPKPTLDAPSSGISPLSSEPPSSPSDHKFARAATIGVGGSLFKKAALEYQAPSLKRVPGRRPTISALVGPNGFGQQPQSAYPIITTAKEDPLSAGIPTMPAPRRAFSAMIPPGKVPEPSSDDFDDAHDSSPAAAAYAKRHQVRVIRRCDGSEDLRPLNGAGSLGKRDRDQFQDKGCSPRSLAGFGVNEVEKKILPCHRVSDDGLVRITPSTMRDLLEGTYSSKISSCTVIDCRFDYEYAGGHIPGAINLNTNAAVEEFFLGESKPEPCESGDPNARHIVVFHCEFSMKRAPTFAKHVRAKDRAINGRVYPKVCYPELYILEGGYSQFYKEFPTHCDPKGYVQMDDPAHLHARNEELNNFRRGKWARTQSYTYGQTSTGLSLSSFPSMSSNAESSATTSAASSRENRKTAPSGAAGGPGSMFAAANAARGRRTVPTSNGPSTLQGLSTLDEDASSSACEEGDSLDLGDSPCPPPSKSAGRLSLLGVGSKAMHGGRIGMDRAASFGPSRR